MGEAVTPWPRLTHAFRARRAALCRQPLHPEVRTGCSIVLTEKSRPKEGGFPFGSRRSGVRLRGLEVGPLTPCRVPVGLDLVGDLLSFASPLKPERSTALMCTNTSLLPSSGPMKPKPLSVEPLHSPGPIPACPFAAGCTSAAPASRVRARGSIIWRDSLNVRPAVRARGPVVRPKVDERTIQASAIVLYAGTRQHAWLQKDLLGPHAGSKSTSTTFEPSGALVFEAVRSPGCSLRPAHWVIWRLASLALLDQGQNGGNRVFEFGDPADDGR